MESARAGKQEVNTREREVCSNFISNYSLSCVVLCNYLTGCGVVVDVCGYRYSLAAILSAITYVLVSAGDSLGRVIVLTFKTGSVGILVGIGALFSGAGKIYS